MVLTKAAASIYMKHGSSYLLKSISTPCRSQTPWRKSHPGDSDNHTDDRTNVTVDLKVWPTSNKLC